jgi:uncharacterized phage protein (TIGR01671 family)
MREILFRGKRKDNGEWVQGFYAIQSNHACFQSGLKYVSFILKDEFMDWGLGGIAEYEVIPETVGQYTGLHDKNGNKIFEGDIISATALDTGEEQRTVVCFGNFIDENNDDEYIGFFIEFDGIKTTITQLSMEECKNRIEVIGNIYDNKELLK